MIPWCYDHARQAGRRWHTVVHACNRVQSPGQVVPGQVVPGQVVPGQVAAVPPGWRMKSPRTRSNRHAFQPTLTTTKPSPILTLW